MPREAPPAVTLGYTPPALRQPTRHALTAGFRRRSTQLRHPVALAPGSIMSDRPSPRALRHSPPPRLRPEGALRVLQITDTHLYADPDRCVFGVNSLSALTAVLDRIAEQAGDFDLVLATGDLVDDAAPQGYLRLREHLAALQRPVYCLPGNHDSPSVMAELLDQGGVTLASSAVHGDWVFVLLDSTVRGKVGGHLDAGQLSLLEERLCAHADRHALICLHHQPVPIGSAWMDPLGLSNAPELFAVIDRHPQVRGLLWGHIHQELDTLLHGVRLLGTPATCVQFAPGLDRMRIDEALPGYRWLILHADGRIDTGVDRVPTLPPAAVPRSVESR